MELIGRGLIKRHPGVLALDGVDLDVRGGEVHAIVGENGAGKSTLMRVLSGAARPDAGTLTIDGTRAMLNSPHAAHAYGIRMIHQELVLVPEMTVAENIVLGSESSRFGVVDRGRQDETARAVLHLLGQDAIRLDAKVADITLAQRQMTEIAKAVSQHARCLILDEPTAILSQGETEALFAVIAKLRQEGVAILYISHRLEEIFRIADRVTVLRDGRVVGSAPAAELSRNEVVRMMVGRELATGYPTARSEPGAEVLRLESVSAGPVRDISLSLRKGEIVGLVGLVGSGRTEVIRTIFGADRVHTGAMFLDGHPYAPSAPHDAITSGIALLPEDRKAQGLVLLAAVRENVTLGRPPANRLGIVDRETERLTVGTSIDALAIRTPSQEQPVRLLSGGNQQKVVLARWMLAHARILLFDEPTRGIDVGAKAEIYALMRALADDGAAILMVSSELPEALGLSDRLLVMRDGQLVGELSRKDATQERIAALTLGERSAA